MLDLAAGQLDSDGIRLRTLRLPGSARPDPVLRCNRDTTIPGVASTYPALNATEVPRNDRLYFQFSEAMDHATTEAAFTISPEVPPITGTFSWSGIRCSPRTRSATDTTYTMTVNVGAQRLGRQPPDRTLLGYVTTGESNDLVRDVWMLGRSVMHGWFVHWGSDPSQPYRHDRFTLTDHELPSPPDMVNSVRAIIDSIAERYAGRLLHPQLR